MATDYLFPNCPPRFNGLDIDALLLHAEQFSFSDMHILTDQKIMIDVHGRKQTIVDRPLTNGEVLSFISHINGDASQAQLSNVEPIDTSHDIKPERGVRYRYRVNAQGIMVFGRDGIGITIRAISPVPPPLSFHNLEQEIWDSFWPAQGIILVTGATGSGKSTLLASCIAELAMQAETNKKIVTGEAPIEYVYDTVDKPSTVVQQCEIPRHVKSFSAFLENAMRQKPDIIVVGEMRDRASISAAITAAQTGHLVLSTAHTNGVAETVRRLVTAFPGDEQSMRQNDIVEALRIIVTQRLIPTKDGKRTPIREFRVFDEADRVAMSSATPAEISAVTRKIVSEKGQTMVQDLNRKWAEGILDETTYRSLLRGYGG